MQVRLGAVHPHLCQGLHRPQQLRVLDLDIREIPIAVFPVHDNAILAGRPLLLEVFLKVIVTKKDPIWNRILHK